MGSSGLEDGGEGKGKFAPAEFEGLRVWLVVAVGGEMGSARGEARTGEEDVEVEVEIAVKGGKSEGEGSDCGEGREEGGCVRNVDRGRDDIGMSWMRRPE